MYMKFLSVVDLFFKCLKLFLKVVYTSWEARITFSFSNILTFVNWCMYICSFLLRKASYATAAVYVSKNTPDPFTTNCFISILTNNFVLFPFSYNPVPKCWVAFISYEWLFIPICVYEMKGLVHFTRDLINTYVFSFFKWIRRDSLNVPSAGSMVLCREALSWEELVLCYLQYISLSLLIATWQLSFAQHFWNMLILLLVSGVFRIFKNPTRLLKSVAFTEELSIPGVLFSLTAVLGTEWFGEGFVMGYGSLHL